MEFRLDEGQVELQATVARFCSDRFPLDAVAGREGAPTDRATWAGLAGLGVFGVVDLGVLEAALVFEQLGSHLVPGPLLWNVLAADLVDGADTGRVIVGGVEAKDVDAGVALVEHAADLDAVLVVHDDRIVAHRTFRVGPALDPFDPLTPVAPVSGLAGGDVVGDAPAAARARVLGTVLTAAQLGGVAARSLEVARAHALARRQFGVPIGSFQAVQHLLADMYVRSGLAQSAVYAAAAASAVAEPDPAHAARGAKLLAGEAAIANAGTAVQVLGGMGFTWDMLPNHLVKRAWVLERAFGDADDHALALGASLVGSHGP